MTPNERRASAADARSVVAAAAREQGHDLHPWTDSTADLYVALTCCRFCGAVALAGCDVNGELFGEGRATMRPCERVSIR